MQVLKYANRWWWPESWLRPLSGPLSCSYRTVKASTCACTAALQCFKVVSALFERQLRKTPSASERVNVLYAVHKVLRSAKKQLRNKSRYRECGAVVVGQLGMRLVVKHWHNGGTCSYPGA